MYIDQAQMEIEKHWSELCMTLTEDDNGRVRPGEEKELMRLWIEDFFIKLSIFEERLKKKSEDLKNITNSDNIRQQAPKR